LATRPRVSVDVAKLFDEAFKLFFAHLIEEACIGKTEDVAVAIVTAR
jgi:hypothetical protein